MNRTEYQAARLRLDHYHQERLQRLTDAIVAEEKDYEAKAAKLREALDESEPPREYPVKCPWCGEITVMQDGTDVKLDGSHLRCPGCGGKFVVLIRALDFGGGVSVSAWRLSDA